MPGILLACLLTWLFNPPKHQTNTEDCHCQSDHPLLKYETIKRIQIPVTGLPFEYILPDQFDFLPAGTPPEIRVNHYKTNGAYVAVLHDPYRRLLYRLAAHAQEPALLTGGEADDKVRAPWSILVIDADSRRCLGEAEFERKQYDFFDIWVTPEGLLIREDKPYRQEEGLSFSLVNLVE